MNQTNTAQPLKLKTSRSNEQNKALTFGTEEHSCRYVLLPTESLSKDALVSRWLRNFVSCADLVFGNPTLDVRIVLPEESGINVDLSKSSSSHMLRVDTFQRFDPCNALDNITGQTAIFFFGPCHHDLSPWSAGVSKILTQKESLSAELIRHGLSSSSITSTYETSLDFDDGLFLVEDKHAHVVNLRESAFVWLRNQKKMYLNSSAELLRRPTQPLSVLGFSLFSPATQDNNVTVHCISRHDVDDWTNGPTDFLEIFTKAKASLADLNFDLKSSEVWISIPDIHLQAAALEAFGISSLHDAKKLITFFPLLGWNPVRDLCSMLSEVESDAVFVAIDSLERLNILAVRRTL